MTDSRTEHSPKVGPSAEELEAKVATEWSESERATRQQSWQHHVDEPNAEAPYNQFPPYFFAGFWVRMISFIVDLLCIAAITNCLINPFFVILGLERSNEFLSVYSLLSLLVYLSYFVLLTKLNQGQTIGKMIFGLKVVCFKEAELSWQTVLIREGACRFFLHFPLTLIGYLPTAFSKRKQHVGDMFSDTSVVTLNMLKAFTAKEA